ncbi:histidine kinase [Micromonospora sp. AMSO31t]|uniref:histidine kinase n=1 Tax=Micromonospora sp. AMSO31t TaxID=2650566 RepID=UPI00124B3EBA|nr:histidine kinase [Micromonospora sp. AMSO31t]KAB1912156.1 two-component sensor histidine kinase [Micromonospora sp. AMSO31t]
MEPPRTPPPVRRRAGDLLLWAVVAAPVAYAGLTPPWPRHAVPLLVGSLALLGLAVAFGRRWPLAALLAVVLGSLVDGNFVFGIPVFSYLAGRRSARAGRVAAVFGAIAVAGTAVNLGLLGTNPETWFLLASVLLFAGVFPWLLGRLRRQQRALAEAGERHAEAEERERRDAVERVRLRERARIAQDMHDSLGHDLSLIALRAAALELAADLPPAHRDAAGELRASVSAATERLHDIIGVLREERSGSLRPAGETVAELVDGARDAGMAVELVDGARDAGLAVELRADPDGVALPPLVAHAVHRVVREALTNAARYAPGAPVTVTVDRTGGAVAVSVVNGRAPAGPLPGPASHGSGLLALRERVRLAGGVLDAGPRDGGFAVTAHLPLRAALAPADADRSGGRAVPAAAGPGDGRSGGLRTGSDVLAVPAGVGAGDGRSDGWAVGRRDGFPGSADEPDDGLGDDGFPDDGRTGRAPGDRPGDAARRLREARRRARRSLLVAFGAPAGLALVLALVYYPLATAGAVLDRSGFERLRLGEERDALGLPRRQADPPAEAATAGCEFYTDGNFPFAEPTWRLCFTDGRLVSKERIAG